MNMWTKSLAVAALVACNGGEPSRNDSPGEARHDVVAPAAGAGAEAVVWTCSMHPEVQAAAPGRCPKCGMDLVPAGPAGATSTHSGAEHMARMAEVRDKLRSKLGASYDGPVPGLDAADRARGARVYAERCASCHGASGKGDGPAGMALDPRPSDHTDAAHARYYTDAGRIEIIRNGIPLPGSLMVGVSGSLTDPEILDLYAFVASLRQPVPAGGSGGDGGDTHEHGQHQH